MSEYSPTWYELFLQSIAADQTEREAAFVARWLPQPEYRALLDLCCGPGRHARALARRGYHVTGVDSNAAAIAEARRASAAEASNRLRPPDSSASNQPSAEQVPGSVTFVQHDMRHLEELHGAFDGLTCLWQSFGYFDAATNASILQQIGAKLRPGGRLLLDIYHRGFFERNQGTRSFERAGRTISETKRMDGDRLTVVLDYGADQPADTYAWQLFLPEEIAALGRQCGFTAVQACANFDEATAPLAETPRMQLVFER
jgi:SAM-dependent methyltransferase